MDQVTLLIAAIGSLLVLLLPASLALAAYVGVLVWYPYYLTVQVGTIDISVGRVLIMVLLARCLISRRLRGQAKPCSLDLWVMASLVIHAVVYCLANPVSDSVENQAGNLVDTAFVYLCFRLIIRDRASFMAFVKLVSLVLVPLAIIGVMEAVSGQYFFVWMARYCRWARAGSQLLNPSRMKPRLGFTRAFGPYSHPIMFGVTFGLFLPLTWALRREASLWRGLAWILAGFVVLGALSSMSSGPWMMLIVVLFVLAMERWRKGLKYFVFALLAVIPLVGIISNRPIYHVVFSYANPLGGAGWHRARLIDAAIDTFGQWWLLGYGGRDPGWGRYVGMAFADITNYYLWVACQAGLAGLVSFCGMLAVAIRNLLFTVKTVREPWLVSVAWSLFSSIVGLMIFFLSVGLFGQPRSLFYGVLGIVASLTEPVRRRAIQVASRRRGTTRRVCRTVPACCPPGSEFVARGYTRAARRAGRP